MSPEDEARIREIVREEIRASKRKPKAAPAVDVILLNPMFVWEGITDLDRKLWREAYPGVIIPVELGKAAAWIKADPSRRKTKWARFLNGWLSRAQNRSQGLGAKPEPAAHRAKKVVPCVVEEGGAPCGAEATTVYLGVWCCERHENLFIKHQPAGRFTIDEREQHPDYEVLRAAHQAQNRAKDATA